MKEYNDSYDMCPYCGHEKNAAPKELYFLTEGTVIQKRYEIGTSVGNGGFGITYKAWDRTLQKTVAVKEYYPAGLVNRVPGEKKMIIYSGSRERECMNGKIRFLEEARNMAK
ncbi:MAG: serine/threonine protein kinase, partial [Lachnospiraceae bacterium]